jgi:Ca-activated chloride channel homolog
MRMLTVVGMLAVLAAGGVAEGNRRYAAGDYAGAAEAYAEALARGDTSAVLRYNLGTALLQLGRYDEALPHLEAAAREGSPPPVRARGHYNGGGADLEPAFAGSVTDGAERRTRLRRAVRHYRDALRLDPGDDDARWNLELAQRLLTDDERPARDTGGGGDEDDGDEADADDRTPPVDTRQPSQAPAPEQGDRRVTSSEEAERILDAAQARELTVQQRQLQRPQRSVRGQRDW